MINSSIWPIDGTLTSTTTVSQSGSESNGNKGVLQIPQTPRQGLNSFKFYLTQIIIFNINHLFVYS